MQNETPKPDQQIMAAFHIDASKPLAENLTDMRDGTAILTQLWPHEYRIYSGYINDMGAFQATSVRICPLGVKSVVQVEGV